MFVNPGVLGFIIRTLFKEICFLKMYIKLKTTHYVHQYGEPLLRATALSKPSFLKHSRNFTKVEIELFEFTIKSCGYFEITYTITKIILIFYWSQENCIRIWSNKMTACSWDDVKLSHLNNNYLILKFFGSSPLESSVPSLLGLIQADLVDLLAYQHTFLSYMCIFST